MKKVNFFNSLRFRMPAVVLMGVVPLMLLALFYATDRASKTIRKEAYKNITLKANSLAENIKRWNELNILATHNLAKQPDIISMNQAKQKPVLNELLNTYQHLYLAMTTNQKGWNVTRSDTHKPVHYGDREWFLGAIKGNHITHQVLIDRTGNKQALCLSTPIKKQKSQIVGVAVLCTKLEDVVKRIGDLRFGETGYALVVNPSGTILAHPDPAILSGKELKNLSNYPPIKNVLNGGSGNFSFKDVSGVKWLSHSTSLANGWGIVVLQQEAEFLKNEQEFQKLGYLIAATAVLGVSILTWVLANRLTQPISDLTIAASAIANGNLDREVNVNSKNELGILAQSFNLMATKLKRLFEELENRIEKRTIQLEEATEAKDTAEAVVIAKDRFLANVSHELRTPLNSILGYTQIVLRDAQLPPTQVEHLNIVQQSGKHLLTLINDLLDFAQQKAGKMELNLTELNLSTFLSQVLEIVEIWAKEKNLQLKCEVAKNLPAIIQTDEKRLRQVLINLLSNAVKFTPTGEVILRVNLIEPPVEVSSFLPQAIIRFEVSDTGVGIAPQQLETIFQPFEQVCEVEFRTTGVGLGLSISQELVKLMGSQLLVESELGVGSTFWFDLLVPVEEIEKEPQPNTIQRILGYAGRKRKLLVVDDQEENRLLLVNMLQPLGFEIVTADNGEEMLEKIASIQPDLILLDLYMPIKTGFTSAKQLRKQPETKHIPIIILSASSLTQEMPHYIECEGVLSKPIDEEKLLAYLQQYLGLEWVYQG